MSQVCITFGVLIAFIIGLGVGDVETDNINSFEIQDYWVIVFAVPLTLACAQVFFLLFVFTYDTPYVLKGNRDTEKLNEFMNKIYTTPEKAQERIGLIPNPEDLVVVDITYGELFCGDKYGRANRVGCILSAF